MRDVNCAEAKKMNRESWRDIGMSDESVATEERHGETRVNAYAISDKQTWTKRLNKLVNTRSLVERSEVKPYSGYYFCFLLSVYASLSLSSLHSMQITSVVGFFGPSWQLPQYQGFGFFGLKGARNSFGSPGMMTDSVSDLSVLNSASRKMVRTGCASLKRQWILAGGGKKLVQIQKYLVRAVRSRYLMPESWGPHLSLYLAEQ